MRPAFTQRPRESRILPHRPAGIPATWKAPGARISDRGPLRGLAAARAPSGRSPAHRHGPRGPSGAERKVRPAYSTIFCTFSSVSKKLTSKILSPQSPQLHEQRQKRLYFRAPAGQPNALKDGGFPGSPCAQVGVAADALAWRCSLRMRRYGNLPQSSGVPPSCSRNC